MRLFRTLLMSLTAVTLVATPALSASREAQREARREAMSESRRDKIDRARDQDRAYRSKVRGEALSYPEIKERVMPYMGDAVPLGPDIRGGNYLVKFMRGGRVIWVEVDPSTGRILGRTR